MCIFSSCPLGWPAGLALACPGFCGILVTGVRAAQRSGASGDVLGASSGPLCWRAPHVTRRLFSDVGGVLGGGSSQQSPDRCGSLCWRGTDDRRRGRVQRILTLTLLEAGLLLLSGGEPQPRQKPPTKQKHVGPFSLASSRLLCVRLCFCGFAVCRARFPFSLPRAIRPAHTSGLRQPGFGGLSAGALAPSWAWLYLLFLVQFVLALPSAFLLC